ncbi:xanthine dehydrogenase-like [Littorina saxatilis]|uniref:Uncharacterized protein n=1 Tax=Littorina saxatilis TaxID=31220 RepID=A0AAN9BV33_9CAEN
MPATNTQKPQSNRATEGDTVTFFINGKKQTVHVQSGRYSARSTLSEYIRSLGLTGTKTACQEGGCGACAVVATFPDAQRPDHFTTHAINACLCPLFSVDGWQITTVEALGNEKDGFHPIQKRIAKTNGSQCGYCTPGVVMAMYGLLQEKPQPTEKDIEGNFDSNLCRCTGYRAILDAMKSFGVDSSDPEKCLIDIEDLNKKLCPGTGRVCTGASDHNGQAAANGAAANGAAADGTAGDVIHEAPIIRPLRLQLDGVVWVRPLSLQELGDALREHSNARVRMLFGNTSTGIFKEEGPFDVFIDISQVKELSELTVVDMGVQIGANVTLSALCAHLDRLRPSRPGFAYFEQLVQHLKLVGNVLVRNSGSIGGNLYLKHAHPDFPSDVFTMLEAAGATVSLYDSSGGSETRVSLVDLVTSVHMHGKVIKSVFLPALDRLDHYRSFKVTPRSQNAHAYVNAAVKIKVTEDHKQILGRPALVFGGIDDKLIHANATEQFLTGKEITTAVVQEGVALLKSELNPTPRPVLASPLYRIDLAASFLYKTLLGLVSPSDPKLMSGAGSLERPLSSAIQTFQEKKDEWPLKQPMPKKTALLQTSGEAIFVNDMPRFQHELCAAFVQSTVARARVQSVDPSPALEIPGVERYLSSSDITAPGRNILSPWFPLARMEDEELLSSGKIDYAGQPIGIILAETQQLADLAAQKVVVKYTDVEEPVLGIRQGIAANSFNTCDIKPVVRGNPDDALKEAQHTLEGEVSMGTQYHFYMENQVSLCVPSEDGVDLYSSTQNLDQVQAAVATVLGKTDNFVNMHVPRLGGGFGGKATTSIFPASGAALAATCTGRPVRMSLSLAANMALAGKRFPVLAKYKVGYTDEGKLQVVMVDIYMDGGFTFSNNAMLNEVLVHMDHGYYVPAWKLTPFNVRTNTPTNVACRSPGPVPALLIIETVLEHVAKSLNKHPVMVKEVNLYEKHQTDLGGHVLTYCTMREVWSRLKAQAEVDARIAEIQTFNEANQWKKRGLTMSGIKHGLMWIGTGFPAQVSIFAFDGTVTVSQSGVEMGQGLFTKVAQATAHALGVPLDMVKVRPLQSLVANNSMFTGGSTTSEQCVYAVQQCCKMLRERMQPIKAKYPDADWVTLCRKAMEAKVDLGARYTNFGEPGSPRFNYFAYCAGVFETEVDVLTGEYLVRRVDIMYDCGESLNPLIDIGQIEGAFIMGLGCHLMEDIVHDPRTGRILNDGTWEYKIPTTKDIPVDWRIHLLPDAPNPVGVNSSKAVGEPPVAMGCGPLLALRQSMEAAVKDLTGSSPFIEIESPMTPEKIQQGCKVTVQDMIL